MHELKLVEGELFGQKVQGVGSFDVHRTDPSHRLRDDVVVVEEQAAPATFDLSGRRLSFYWRQHPISIEDFLEPRVWHQVGVGNTQHPTAVVARRIVEHLQLLRPLSADADLRLQRP